MKPSPVCDTAVFRTRECHLELIEVCPPTRLEFVMQVDFIPSVDPYVVKTAISIDSNPSEIKLTVFFDAMHDEDYTKRVLACHAS